MAVTPLARPDIREFDSYRRYMEAYYLHKKSLRAGFSFRAFSAKADIRSPNYLQLVIQGKRNLSREVGGRVAKVMALSGPEREYFLALIRQEHSQSDEEQHDAERALLRSINRLVNQRIANHQAEVLSRWYHLVVRELTFLPGFEASGAWISRIMRGVISPHQAEESLDLLRKAGFLTVCPERGKLKAVDPVVDTGDAFDFARVLNAHLENLAVWRTVLTDVAPKDRELGLLNIPVHSSRIPEFKQRIRDFQEEIIGWLQNEQQADQVVQLGCYLVPLTHRETPPVGSPSQQ